MEQIQKLEKYRIRHGRGLDRRTWLRVVDAGGITVKNRAGETVQLENGDALDWIALGLHFTEVRRLFAQKKVRHVLEDVRLGAYPTKYHQKPAEPVVDIDEEEQEDDTIQEDAGFDEQSDSGGQDDQTGAGTESHAEGLQNEGAPPEDADEGEQLESDAEEGVKESLTGQDAEQQSETIDETIAAAAARVSKKKK